MSHPVHELLSLWRDILYRTEKKRASWGLKKDEFNLPNKQEILKPKYYDVFYQEQLFHLTKREVECLFLIKKNFTNADIAKTLFLSERTIEFYIKNLRKKFNFTHKRNLRKIFSELRFAKLKREDLDIPFYLTDEILS